MNLDEIVQAIPEVEKQRMLEFARKHPNRITPPKTENTLNSMRQLPLIRENFTIDNEGSIQAGADGELRWPELPKGIENAPLFFVNAQMQLAASAAAQAAEEGIKLEPPSAAGVLLLEKPMNVEMVVPADGNLNPSGFGSWPDEFKQIMADRPGHPTTFDSITWGPISETVFMVHYSKTTRACRAGEKGERSTVSITMTDYPLDMSIAPKDVPAVRFLAAAWHLMQQPTITEATTHRLGRPSKTLKARNLPTVRVVKLRPMRYINCTHDANGRQYKHRWIVRGHWRNQPHGPGLQKTRLTYIPPHIKGPENAPFIGGDLVNAWIR